MANKKDKYISYFKNVGFLIDFNDMDLYHGRTQANDDKWEIITDFNNSHSVNQDNIMNIPCLCVASHDIAESYARGTSLNGRSGKMMVYKIVAEEGSFVVNENLDIEKFSENEKFKFNNAVQSFFNGTLSKYLEGKTTKEDQLKALKTHESMVKNPTKTVSDYVFNLDDEKIDSEYLELLLKRRNIIGIKKKDRTIESKNKDIVYVFDLSKVKVQEPEIEVEQ